MVIGCLFVSLASIILALTAPLYIPDLTLLYYLVCTIFFDWQGGNGFDAILWNFLGNFLVFGILQGPKL